MVLRLTSHWLANLRNDCLGSSSKQLIISHETNGVFSLVHSLASWRVRLSWEFFEHLLMALIVDASAFLPYLLWKFLWSFFELFVVINQVKQCIFISTGKCILMNISSISIFKYSIEYSSFKSGHIKITPCTYIVLRLSNTWIPNFKSTILRLESRLFQNCTSLSQVVFEK